MLREFPVKFSKKRRNGKPMTLATISLFSEDKSKKLTEKEKECSTGLWLKVCGPAREADRTQHQQQLCCAQGLKELASKTWASQ